MNGNLKDCAPAIATVQRIVSRENRAASDEVAEVLPSRQSGAWLPKQVPQRITISQNLKRSPFVAIRSAVRPTTKLSRTTKHCLAAPEIIQLPCIDIRVSAQALRLTCLCRLSRSKDEGAYEDL